MSVAIITLAVLASLLAGALLWTTRGWLAAKDTILTERVDKTVTRLDLATMTDVARREKERADALDTLLQDLASDRDPAGARERVLARYRRDAAARGAGDGARPAIPGEPAEPRVDRDGLIRPGE